MKKETGKTIFGRLAMSFFAVIFFSVKMYAGSADTVNVIPSPVKYDLIPGIVADEDEVRAGLLYDVTRNTIVWQKDMEYAYPIASLTKMMVGLLAFEDIAAGKVSLDDHILVTRTFKKKISRRRYACVASKEEYTLEDLLKMAMVGSHNESTIWIARHCSGDVATFVERMNKKAAELGMAKTQYSNTSGLPAIIDELDNSASAHDMLTLALEVMKHPKLIEITSIPYATVSNGKGHDTYRNHNGLVITYNNEVDGIKTGYTKAAKFCLVCTSNRAGYPMVSVVFGVRSPWVRNGIVASMMNTYYDALKIGRLGETLPDLAESIAFRDSLNRGLAFVKPSIEPRHKDSSDESYAFTYKTVTEKIRKTHTVRSGDNLGKIADRYNVAVADVKKWNKIKGSSIRAGQHLNIYTVSKKRVPVKLVVDPDESYADNQPPVQNDRDCNTEVTVESVSSETTDTVNAKAIAVVEKAQNFNSEKGVKTKSVQKDSIAKKAVKISNPNFVYHVVQPGDTLWNIAQRYQATVDQIKKANKIGKGKILRSGTRIKIPVKRG